MMDKTTTLPRQEPIHLPKDITVDEYGIVIRCTPGRYTKKYTSHKALARVLAERDQRPLLWWRTEAKVLQALQEKQRLQRQRRTKKYITLLESTFPQLVG